MNSLLEAAARARNYIESSAVLDEPARQSLRQLVEFAIAAFPAPTSADVTVRCKSRHTLYTHENNRCCVTIEPHDLRTPYYEWRRVYGSWALYNRHCWRDDALRIASGRVRSPLETTAPGGAHAPDSPHAAPRSSRPPPAPCAGPRPTVEVMSLEEQIRQLLLVEKDRGEYNGTTERAVRCLEAAGFDLNSPDVLEALWRVARGTYYRELRVGALRDPSDAPMLLRAAVEA
jgi:hypothetical protein